MHLSRPLSLLNVRVKRNTGEQRHLSLAVRQYLAIFLGAELPGIFAAEYAIFQIVHSFLLSAFALLMLALESRCMLHKL